MDNIRKIIHRYLHADRSEITRDRFGVWLLSEEDGEAKERVLKEEWNALCKKHFGTDGRDLRKGIFVRWWAVAAALTALIGIGFALRTGRPVIKETRLVTSVQSKGWFTLPDGSTVWLNSASSLTFHDGFADGRKVTLDGEAFFNVAKDGRPFTVMAGEMAVRVLGTEFSVRHSPHYKDDLITLQTGSVQVEVPRHGKALLTPGQQYVYDKVTSEALVQRIDTDNYTSWIRESLAFEDTAFGDILENLRHWYNVDISVGDGIDTTLRMSFKVPREPMEETMHLIAAVTGYRCRVLESRDVSITLE